MITRQARRGSLVLYASLGVFGAKFTKIPTTPIRRCILKCTGGRLHLIAYTMSIKIAIFCARYLIFAAVL
jgi:hypothetical protein